MAPQLTVMELDRVAKLQNKGKTPGEISNLLATTRTRQGLAGPNVSTVRRALKGSTHKRGRVETRGRKKKLTRLNVRTLNAKRKDLQKKAIRKGQVRWADILKAAKLPAVANTTVKRAFKDAGINVALRRPREKPTFSKDSRCLNVLGSMTPFFPKESLA